MNVRFFFGEILTTKTCCIIINITLQVHLMYNLINGIIIKVNLTLSCYLVLLFVTCKGMVEEIAVRPPALDGDIMRQ